MTDQPEAIVISRHQYSWDRLKEMSYNEMDIAAYSIPMTPINLMMWQLNMCSRWRLYVASHTLEEVWNAAEPACTRETIYIEMDVEKVGVSLTRFVELTFPEFLRVLHAALNNYYLRNLKDRGTELWATTIADMDTFLCKMMTERGVVPPEWVYDEDKVVRVL